MKVAAIQYDIAWESPSQNFTAVQPRIRAAVGAGARLVLLPEMYACGFSMNTQAIAEPADGPSTQFIIDQARLHGTWIGGSVPRHGEGSSRPFNTFVLSSPTGEVHRYDKIHPFTFAKEHEHYTAGDRFVTVDIEGVRCTLFICYDLRFADEFWATASGTDCYLVIANWPSKRRHHWQTLLQARAIENQAYVVGLNRVGRGGDASGLEYLGDSRIIDPWGEILAAGAKTETTLIADVDPTVVHEARTRFPILPDRR